MPGSQVVACAIFRRCTAPKSLSNAKQPAAVRCKPSHPIVLLLQAQSSNAVPRRTDSYQAMLAAAARCKQPKPTSCDNPCHQHDFGRHRLSSATPFELPTLHRAALPGHRRVFHDLVEMDLHQRRLQRGNDAKCTAVARPTSGHGFHPEKNRATGTDFKMTPPTRIMTPPMRRMTPSDTIVIATSM